MRNIKFLYKLFSKRSVLEKSEKKIPNFYLWISKLTKVNLSITTIYYLIMVIVNLINIYKVIYDFDVLKICIYLVSIKNLEKFINCKYIRTIK